MNRLGSVWGVPLLLACNVLPGGTTGGVDQSASAGCPRGIVAMQSDFQSSELALLSPEGAVESVAFMSSASTETSGVAAPLSGDVVVGSSPTDSGEIVLVDRLGTNVVSFVDPKTARVRAQLPVGTGFESNPQGYVEVSAHKAYVPRLGQNARPGRQAFDAGSDLLLLDPSVPEIIGSLPMPVKSGFLPNPAAVTVFGDSVLVVLQHARPDYSAMAEAEIVAFSGLDESLLYRAPLLGLKNCGRVEPAPSGQFLAIACSAFVDRKGAVDDLSASGIVLLDPTEQPPRELRRFTASELVGVPIQASLEFVTDDLLLFKSQTALGAEQNNQLFSLGLESGVVTLLATANPSDAGLGYGVALGGMCCLPGCTATCLVTDASRGTLLRFVLNAAGSLQGPESFAIGGAGLPPISLIPYF